MQSKLCDGFAFAGGMPMLRIPARKAADGRVAGQGLIEDTTTVLYDLASDPGQNSPLDDPDIIAKMEQHLSRLLLRNEAPPEAWRRLGLAS